VSLPLKQDWSMAQNTWATQLNPVISSPLSTPTILKQVHLALGANTVNHKLGQTLQGWFVTRYYGSWAQIYDTQATNQTPQLTLNLNASSAVIVDLVVFA
jgi:hypothetical protein